jgi:hypothetical protein
VFSMELMQRIGFTHVHITNRSLRERTGRTLWVIELTTAERHCASLPQATFVRTCWACCPFRRGRTDRALWSARAGSRGLSGKGRKSQRSSNPASQRYRVVGFHDVSLSGFALSAPVARAVTDTRSPCVRWAGNRGLPSEQRDTVPRLRFVRQ